MNILIEPRALSVSFDRQNMWVEMVDGRILGVPLAYFPKLLKASDKARKKYTLSGGGIGIHWDALDEDILVSGLLLGVGDRAIMQKRSLSENPSAHA